jgi:hypothetical protein
MNSNSKVPSDAGSSSGHPWPQPYLRDAVTASANPLLQLKIAVDSGT